MNKLSIVQRSVLVIDDEPAIGEAIALVAERLGMSCTVLTSGLQLGEQLDRRRVVAGDRQPLPEDELRAAISDRAVVVHYQPQVSLATG